MSKTPQLELVSFDICPYVQRSVITLKHKKVDFKLTFIDLNDTPEWFNKISPLGKVPLLLVRNSENSEPIVLFESAPINEYIDDITPPLLSANDPLERAHERAWIAVSGELLMNLFNSTTAEDESEAKEATDEMWETLSHIEKGIAGNQFFAKRGFSLVDAAFAPFFVRMLMMKSMRSDSRWKSLPKTHAWAKTLVDLPEVRASVVPQFKERFASMLEKFGSRAAQDLG